MVDVDEEGSWRRFSGVNERNFDESSSACALVVGAVAPASCDYVLAYPSDILRCHKNSPA